VSSSHWRESSIAAVLVSSYETLSLVAASSARALARRSRCARPPPHAPTTRLLDEAVALERATAHVE